MNNKSSKKILLTTIGLAVLVIAIVGIVIGIWKSGHGYGGYFVR